jgi:hypothetical protein
MTIMFPIPDLFHWETEKTIGRVMMKWRAMNY